MDWLGFAGSLQAPADAASSPASFLLPPAPPLEDRAAAQPEPKPSKTGQHAGGDFELRAIVVFSSEIVSRSQCLGNLSSCSEIYQIPSLLLYIFCICYKYENVFFLVGNNTWCLCGDSMMCLFFYQFNGIVLYFGSSGLKSTTWRRLGVHFDREKYLNKTLSKSIMGYL